MPITSQVLDELLKEYKTPDDLLGNNGLLQQLTKVLVERALEGEMTHHLGYPPHDVAGDIAMLESEVNSVVRALRRNNLEVVALHNHMLGDEPRIIFLHYYGRGAAATLAQGFRAALDELGKHKSGMMQGGVRKNV